MPTSDASRFALLAGALTLLSACTTPGGGVPQAPVEVATEASHCPQVQLREGTAIMRRGEGEALQYVASITETTRSCRVVGGELLIEVGVAGQVVPGAAARAGAVELPIRVAVTRGADVLHSVLGRQSVSIAPGGGAQSFTYVDRTIRIPEPADRAVTIQAGFDERN